MSVNGRIGGLLALALTGTALVGAPHAAAAPDAGKRQKTEVPVTMAVSPDPDTSYGVGQLVTVRFSYPIKRKSDVEKAITLSSRHSLGSGAWGWIDDQTAVYRPRKFWPANTKVRFRFRLKDVVLGKTPSSVLVGDSNRTYKFRTARSFVLDIRDSKHRLFVRRNGEVVKSFPVSLGKPGWETRSGIKILTDEKYVRLRMTGYDPGEDERWDVVAPWSIRLTPTGEFIHGAPWAAYRLGLANGSHGCTNMFPRDAKWLYHRVRAGDPVVTRGTGRPMTTDNGIPGAYWNYSWREWQRKSAVTGSPKKWQTVPGPEAAAQAGP